MVAIRNILIAVLLVPFSAFADPVQIAGPSGDLEAEQLKVVGAEHVVVIVPGSGPIDRDGNAPQLGLHSDSYKLLAEGLASQGISSLRIDKRGFFGSAEAIADPIDVTIAAYAKDVRDWVSFAKTLAPCVWVAGHSEGGLVALVAARDMPEGICGLILMATPGRPIGQLMIEQFHTNPANVALLPEVERIIGGLERGRAADSDRISPILRNLFSAGMQRYMIDVFSYDPTRVSADVSKDVLVIHGDADFQVTLTDSSLLENALPRGQKLILNGATHLLKKDVPGDPIATYRDATLPLHEKLVPGIAAFVFRTRP